MTLIEKPAAPQTIISTKKASFPSLRLSSSSSLNSSSSSSNPPSALSSPSAFLNFNFNFNSNSPDHFDLDSFFSSLNSNVTPSHGHLPHPLKRLKTSEGSCSCPSSSCSSNCPSSPHTFSSSGSSFDPLSSSPSTPPPTPLPPFSGPFPFSLDSWEGRSFDFGKNPLEDVLSFPFSGFSQNDLIPLPPCSSLNEQHLKPEEGPTLPSPVLLEDSLGTPSSSLSASDLDLDEPHPEGVPLSPLLSLQKEKRGRKGLISEEQEYEDDDLFEEESEENEENEENEGEEWTAPRRPRPGLSLTKEEIEMALNCYSYLFSSLKNKKKACQEVGTALKIGSRKVFELVQQRELLVQKGAPANCIPKARIEKKRGKARERAIGEAHLALIRKELLQHYSKLGNFPSASQILALLGSLPSQGLPLLHLSLSSPGPLFCNLKTLKGHLTRLRREILSSSPI